MFNSVLNSVNGLTFRPGLFVILLTSTVCSIQTKFLISLMEIFFPALTTQRLLLVDREPDE